MHAFVLFGPSHIAALAIVAWMAGCAIAVSRRSEPLTILVRRGLVTLLLGSGLGALVVGRSAGASWIELAPLHLCDAALLVAAWALMTLRPLACELSYFWSAGSLLALITPDLFSGPPDPIFFFYFAAHGGVVITGMLLPAGLGWRPRAGAVLRAFFLTNIYAAGVLVANLVASTNFLYLLAKPAAPTPLDGFGPWPVYIAVSELIALGIFSLMGLLFRIRGK